MENNKNPNNLNILMGHDPSDYEPYEILQILYFSHPLKSQLSNWEHFLEKSKNYIREKCNIKIEILLSTLLEESNHE